MFWWWFHGFQKRFEGTRVSVATFIAWKTQFDEELAIKKRQQLNIIKEKDPDSKKLSGRELFLRDKTLAESDLQFVEEGIYIYMDGQIYYYEIGFFENI
jgi:hypothetical protein